MNELVVLSKACDEIDQALEKITGSLIVQMGQAAIEGQIIPRPLHEYVYLNWNRYPVWFQDLIKATGADMQHTPEWRIK
jgi:hypothetical protein